MRAADKDAARGPMGAQGGRKGEGGMCEADLTPFVMNDLMSGVQIRAGAEANEETSEINGKYIQTALKRTSAFRWRR